MNKEKKAFEEINKLPPDLNEVQQQIKQKIKTFAKWDVKECLKNRRPSRMAKVIHSEVEEESIFKVMLKFVNDMKKKEQRKTFGKRAAKDKERFRRMSNPLELIHYYITHNKFKPKQEQQELINKLVEIKALADSMENKNLNRVLQEVYYLMNMTVDFNELKLLLLAIILSADLCFEAKDFNRAFYFYNQARIASSSTNNYEVTINSLEGMAKVTFEMKLPIQTVKFLKKALAYAWKIGDTSSEMEIYDLMGHLYSEEGLILKAKYYHERFANNETEEENSVIRKIYIQSIKLDAELRNMEMYNCNVDILLLETICLPISNFDNLPPFPLNVLPDNYVNAVSPRKYVKNRIFSYESFEDAETQIEKVLMQAEFLVETPNPDQQQLHHIYDSSRYNKPKKEREFVRTVEFHRIVGIKSTKSETKVGRKHSLEKKIEMAICHKPEQNWSVKNKSYTEEKKMKKNWLQPSIYKNNLTPRERRSLSSHSEKFKSRINKAILDWIDP